MKLLTFCVFALLLSGCSLVAMVDDYQQNNLRSNGFERHKLELAEGGELHYWQGGDSAKPTLLLLHGFGGNGMTSWYEMMLDLSEDYQIIVPDLLWFGESYSAAPATISSETQAMQQLISQLALSSVNLVGISFGGFVTFDLMIHEPKVDKVVMLASPGLIFSDEDMLAMTKRFGADVPEAVFVPKNGPGVRRLLEKTFVDYPWMPAFIDQQVYEYYFADSLPQKESLITTLPAYRDQLNPDEFADSLPSTILIWGEKDVVFPLDNGRRFAEFLNAPIIVIPDGVHGLSNDFPKQINKEIRAFIQ
ncbi:alpha/beta fold hydrolase [Shewanella sp. 10N.286.51.B2]|uniref:alpha/beta fold hydrolase n=1 Tax=Shewanella sp. 10N.286.51.B2 TaxID=3229707 RepID=UPI003550BD01